MHEQGKAAQRRKNDARFTQRYLVGVGIDVGAGPDPFSKYMDLFPHVVGCRAWDMADGDGTYLEGIPDNSVDFVISSHCLEHLHWPEKALENWVRVVRPGGYVIVTVPDWEMYERFTWPSRYGVGHIYAYTLNPTYYALDKERVPLIFLPDLYRTATAPLDYLSVSLDHFDPSKGIDVDQSMGPAECAIEFVLRKV